MVSYIDVYCDARKRYGPIGSLYYVLNEVKKTHPLLKQDSYGGIDFLFGQIMQSARIMVACVKDLVDLTADGGNEATIEFVRQNLSRAKAHVSHYIGEDTVDLFLEHLQTS